MKKRNYLLLCVLTVCFMGVNAAGEVQVWDFGAEQLASDSYRNMLSVNEINSWYPEGTVAGSDAVPIGSWTANDSCNIYYNADGKTNHRIRTTNTAITRYDNKSKEDAAGTVYAGHLYSNAGSTERVYLASTYAPNDRIEILVGSNGNGAQYQFLAPDGTKQFGNYTATYGVEKLTFYAKAAGEYQLSCLDEKLVVARIYRYPARNVSVSGAVTVPGGIPAGYKLMFTNQQTGVEETAEVISGNYTTQLAAGFDYIISLADANGYVVVNENLTIAYDSEGTTADLNIIEVNLVTLSGNITGLDDAALTKVEFEFTIPQDKVFQPEMTVNGAAYTLTLESGVAYAVKALNVNDYQLSVENVQTSADAAQDLIFAAKPVHAVTIRPTGATAADLAEATFTFDNLNEAGYQYAFTGTQNINLRNGVYSVKVADSGIFTQLLTSNLKVEGAPVEKIIDFTSQVTSWDFKGAEYQSGSYTTSFQGLTIAGGKAHSGGGMSIKNGSITVPVAGASAIVVGTDYEWSYYIDATDSIVEGKSGSTSEKTLYTYNYTGGAGEVVITFTDKVTSYVWSIEVVETASYQETVYVGADKVCKTLNEAMAAIRKMERNAGQTVTVMIDPGNYDEMLVIDRDDIRFVNASATPSIALRNKGVDIDDHAVRITSYYGHGYNYASMGADFKWNARTLQVNKENGYPAVVNGGGAASTYWNATVVVEGKNFYAENIIFENSYNQYISAKEAADLVVEADGGKGTRPATVSSTEVQKRSFRERAAALATTGNSDRTFLNNCRIVGRQDSFYGAESRVACYKGVLMGACDYLFGEMNLTCYQTELALLTDEDKNDVAYITAPKTAAGKRGMLFYECQVVSAQPGVDMNDGNPSKPALWGRPWAGRTSEAIFAGCKIDTCEYNGTAGNYDGKSLILPAGWDAGLSSASERCGEWACNDDATQRISWAVRFTEPQTADGVSFTLFNWTKGADDWNPFADYGVDTQALPVALENDFAPSAVLATTAPDSRVKMYNVKNGVFITNVEKNTDIRIFGIDGRLIDTRRVDMNVHITLPQGLYILRADNIDGKMVGKVMIR